MPLIGGDEEETEGDIEPAGDDPTRNDDAAEPREDLPQ
jgi:hypothetical protein